MKVDKYGRIKMTRKQLCDLLLATTACANTADEGSKWHILHNELMLCLEEYDKARSPKTED